MNAHIKMLCDELDEGKSNLSESKTRNALQFNREGIRNEMLHVVSATRRVPGVPET
jgi:hypothetical protein